MYVLSVLRYSLISSDGLKVTYKQNTLNTKVSNGFLCSDFWRQILDGFSQIKKDLCKIVYRSLALESVLWLPKIPKTLAWASYRIFSESSCNYERCWFGRPCDRLLRLRCRTYPLYLSIVDTIENVSQWRYPCHSTRGVWCSCLRCCRFYRCTILHSLGKNKSKQVRNSWEVKFCPCSKWRTLTWLLGSALWRLLWCPFWIAS